jgi:hypothetical protein
MEEVIAQPVQAGFTTLPYLDEVIDEDIRVPDGALERMVGRGGGVFRFRGKDHHSRDGGERSIRGKVVGLPRGRGPRADRVIHGLGERREPVALGCERRGLEAGVRNIADSFGHGGEGRRGLNPAHGAGQGDAHELGFSDVLGEQKGQPQAFLRGERELVEAILHVVLAAGDRAVSRVSVPYEAEDAMESPSKLHGLRRCMVDGRLVDASPRPWPGVVAEQAGLTVALVLDGSGG